MIELPGGPISGEVGTSSLARALAERLQAAGIKADLTREPGGSPRAEAIRETILSGQIRPHGAFVEALMFSAARIDHIDRRIRPALARGEWVICDRFIDSTRAYQGALGRIDPVLLAELEKVTIDGLIPDLTLILDLDPKTSLARAGKRRSAGEDRLEGENLSFNRKLRAACLAIAEKEPERCAVLDADQPPEKLAEAAWDMLCERLPLTRADDTPDARDQP